VSGIAATGGADRTERVPLAHSLDMVVGLIGGGVAIASALIASNANDARLMLGTLLAGIGFVYLGFAISDGRKSAIVIQAVSALVS
jgi:hypothetical protein